MQNVEAAPTGGEQKAAPSKYGPGAQSVHDIFELLTFYGLILAISAAAAIFAVEFISRIQIGLSSKAETILTLGITLGCSIAINWHFDSPTGKARQSHLRRLAQTYAYPLTLVIGLYGGWQLRHHNHPDPERQFAEQMATRICGQYPDCVADAESASGRDLKRYIRPSAMPHR